MSELDNLIDEIKANAKQKAINKIDEVRVMQTMLNDKEFTISLYDKNNGYIGQRSPYENSRTFVKNVVSGSTGLDSKDAQHLANAYEFTKRDSTFLLENMRDFTQVYMNTGRKMNIIQNEVTEACIFTKPMKATTKRVPDKDNPGKTKEIKTSPYIKLVANTKCPKYHK